MQMYRVNSVWLGNILPLRRLREKKVCQSTLIHSTYCSQKFVLSHYFRSTHIASLPQCMIEECKQCMMWLCSPWRVPNSSFFSSAPKSAILLTVSKHCFCQKVNLIIVLLSRHLICFCLGKKTSDVRVLSACLCPEGISRTWFISRFCFRMDIFMFMMKCGEPKPTSNVKTQGRRISTTHSRRLRESALISRWTEENTWRFLPSCITHASPHWHNTDWRGKHKPFWQQKTCCVTRRQRKRRGRKNKKGGKRKKRDLFWIVWPKVKTGIFQYRFKHVELSCSSFCHGDHVIQAPERT